MPRTPSVAAGMAKVPLWFGATVIALVLAASPAEAVTSIVLKLRAENGSDFSRYKIRINNELVADARVTSSAWTEVSFIVDSVRPLDRNQLAIEHYYDTDSRALHVDRIKVNGAVFHPSDGIQDAGPQDGRNLRTGSHAGHFPWNGILRIDLPAEILGTKAAGGDAGQSGPEPALDVSDSSQPAVVENISSDGSAYFRPPEPLPNLRIYNVQPSGRQSVNGGPDEDLLLVSPNRTIDGKFLLEVNGFRGIYWIGATFNPQPMGYLISPRGKRVNGVGALVRIRPHANSKDRPFVYLDRMRLKTDNITFGDFLQVGGAAKIGNWSYWPDLYRCRMKADPLFGWATYHGGSFSRNVSKSDFTKLDMGGIHHSYAARMDITWGYQGEYVIPTWATNYKGYKGPDGNGRAEYWDYVARAATNPAIGSVPQPKTFFLARSSSEVVAGENHTFVFHEGGSDGRGVFSVPVGNSGSAKPTVHPGGGAYAPKDHGTYLSWPTGSQYPFVIGRLKNGARQAVPSVVSESEIGFKHRVSSRTTLLAAIRAGCGRN